MISTQYDLHMEETSFTIAIDVNIWFSTEAQRIKY